jgi:hypothetical protein
LAEPVRTGRSQNDQTFFATFLKKEVLPALTCKLCRGTAPTATWPGAAVGGPGQFFFKKQGLLLLAFVFRRRAGQLRRMVPAF